MLPSHLWRHRQEVVIRNGLEHRSERHLFGVEICCPLLHSELLQLVILEFIANGFHIKRLRHQLHWRQSGEFSRQIFATHSPAKSVPPWEH